MPSETADKGRKSKTFYPQIDTAKNKMKIKAKLIVKNMYI
ncbi:hypothetical protein N482_03835 [Pseudoalteromonas luteoviolacea NCIMB 1942]|uniref:Uncharacterized protein n=1 Tax=Pseudoalteromonas luteoviolacea NCIMB 1942 TaxID=1365253 RepID=A0A166Y4M3_9GAMM|nr:hypothetical protein N482_03835 [Pseudoalteromonas luteoviolacea NCIMB 1942]